MLRYRYFVSRGGVRNAMDRKIVMLAVMVLLLVVVLVGVLFSNNYLRTQASQTKSSLAWVNDPKVIKLGGVTSENASALAGPSGSWLPTICSCACEPNLCFHAYGSGLPFTYNQCYVEWVLQVAFGDCDNLDGRFCAGWQQGNILPSKGTADCSPLTHTPSPTSSLAPAL